MYIIFKYVFIGYVKWVKEDYVLGFNLCYYIEVYWWVIGLEYYISKD